MKLNNYILSLVAAGSLAGMATSCSDMLDKGNDYVIYADDHMLNNPADTVTSVLGILNKLQGIAVRTNLLGEVRADLVTVNDNASNDLKNLANFNADVTGDDDENKYNVPRDYYAVINNCNYFLSRADSLAGNSARKEYYFVNEIAQVHSIRAWAYLQCVLAYGKVPYFTDPVLTKSQSEEIISNKSNYLELPQLVENLINDLKPYYGTEYPDFSTIGGDIDPQLCFFPTQVVMGDLYLWQAVANQSTEAAKQAALCYYDYIVWDKSGKSPLTTTPARIEWDARQISNKPINGFRPSSYSYLSTNWGSKYGTQITSIPMDSAAADGFYNELRNLYNTTYNTEYVEASISPSSILKELSKSQKYVARNNDNKVDSVTEGDLSEQLISNNYVGDLRFGYQYSTRDITTNNEKVTFQSISKHSSQHISIYRAHQLYLKLAEALNYAGYPRFARQILTMGISNMVIKNEVLPYYPTASDSSFINRFNLNDNNFVPYVKAYAQDTTRLGTITGVKVASLQSDISSTVNMWGIHSKGSGLAFDNTEYCNIVLTAKDSASYPSALEAAVPEMPLKPSSVLLTEDQWNAQKNKLKVDATYEDYVAHHNDSVETYTADMVVYNEALTAFNTEYNKWYKSVYNSTELKEREQAVVDQAILDEQALEMSYEGNRFFDLMRRALWYNDYNKYLVQPISKRNATAGSKLANKSNWYLHWKNQIGL